MKNNKRTATAIGTSLLILHSAAASAGHTFTQVTTTDGEPPSQTKITIDGSSSKSELLTPQANNPFIKPGSYTLMQGEEMFIVTPSEQTFARFDIGMMKGMTQEMSQAGQGPGGSMFQIKDVKVEKVFEEAGERLAGHPTRHYKFKSSWTMAMNAMPMSMEFKAEEDYWTTEAIPVSFPLLESSALPESERESDAAKVLKDIKGFPLRQVTVQSQKTNMNMGPLGALAGLAGGGLGAQTTKTIVEVTSIQEIDVPPETFEIPAGYREVQMFQQGPALPDLNNVGRQAAPLPDLNNVGRQAAPLPDLNTPR